MGPVELSNKKVDTLIWLYETEPWFSLVETLFGPRVLVVGAHWDTVDGTGGLNDNGSGMLSECYLCLCLHGGV